MTCLRAVVTVNRGGPLAPDGVPDHVVMADPEGNELDVLTARVAADECEDRRTPVITPAKSSTGTFGSGTDQVDRVDAGVPHNRCYRLTEA